MFVGIGNTASGHPCNVWSVIDSWGRQAEQASNRHSSELVWWLASCKEVGSFWILLCQWYCSRYSGTVKV